MSVESSPTQTSLVDEEFVAFRVRYELENQDRSQAWLARELDWSDMFTSRRIRGEVPFSAVELAQVAEALGVSITVFFPPAAECAS